MYGRWRAPLVRTNPRSGIKCLHSPNSFRLDYPIRIDGMGEEESRRLLDKLGFSLQDAAELEDSIEGAKVRAKGVPTMPSLPSLPSNSMKTKAILQRSFSATASTEPS